MHLMAASVRTGLAIVAIAATPLAHRDAHADPVIKEKITTYTVSGNTLKEVRADINSKRKAAAGGGYDSINRWNTRWRFTTENTGGSCVVTSVTVTLDIEIVIPKLASNAPTDVRRRFDEYIERLMVHERGHSTHSVAAANEIEPALLAIAPEATCREAVKEANQRANAILARQKEIDKDYDARTRHGATQGATFP